MPEINHQAVTTQLRNSLAAVAANQAAMKAAAASVYATAPGQPPAPTEPGASAPAGGAA